MSSHTNIDGLSAHHSADEVRRQIDQAIQKLAEEIRALKTQRNAHAPISCLPSEILAKIFTLTISDPLAYGAYGALHWIRVTYVSRQWREVALNNPSLWGNLVFARPKWCEEMLKRSKMAGLAVKADLHGMTQKSAEILKLTMLQGHRIRELQLHCTINREMENLLLTLQVPMIRSLSLSLASTYHHNTTQLFRLPTSMLNGETPYLRQLDLRHCNVTWDIPLFNGLTSLTIDNDPGSAKPTIEQLKNTLKRMPALELLDLRNVVPPPTPGTPAALPTESSVVNLTELTDLVISSTASEYIGLISLIRVPTTTRIDFYCADRNSSSIAGPSSASNTIWKRVIGILDIELDDANILTLNGWSTSHLQAIRLKPDVRLRFPFRFSATNDTQRIITDVCSAIDLCHLRTLSVALPFPEMTKQAWIDMFGTLPQLYRIKVKMENIYPLIAALQELPPKPSSSDSLKSPVSNKETQSIPTLSSSSTQIQTKARSPYFPKLKCLTIRACDFSHTGTNFSGTTVIRNCIKYRSRRKAKLHELCLWECRYLYHEDVDSLKEVVNVRWDGLVLEEEEDDDDDDDEMGSDYSF